MATQFNYGNYTPSYMTGEKGRSFKRDIPYEGWLSANRGTYYRSHVYKKIAPVAEQFLDDEAFFERLSLGGYSYRYNGQEVKDICELQADTKQIYTVALCRVFCLWLAVRYFDIEKFWKWEKTKLPFYPDYRRTIAGNMAPFFEQEKELPVIEYRLKCPIKDLKKATREELIDQLVECIWDQPELFYLKFK